MAAKDPYIPTLKQSQIPKQLCERAAWYLNAIGRDLRDEADHEKFSNVWDAYLKLNIPVMCKGEIKAGVKTGRCACYRPVSGVSGKPRRKPKGGRLRW